MKAIYLTKYGSAENSFEYRDTPTPKINDDEVLIKVRYSGINFADIIARNGMYPEAPKNPAILGYDVVGEAIEVGKNVNKNLLGLTVVALTRFGGYAEYAVANKVAVAPVPKNIEAASATALATQACTAYYCAMSCTTLYKGDRVLIQAAAGGVGSILVQLAKHQGCKIYATASTNKIGYLKECGVDVAIDYTKEDFRQVIKDNEKDGCIDVVFDSLGGTSFSKAMKLLGPGGKMICFGAAEQLESKRNKLKLISLALGFGFFSPIALLMKSQAVIMINMLKIADFKPHVFEQILNETISLAENGVILPKLDRVFRSDQIAEAHDYVESRKSMGKVVLSWEP